MKRRMLTAALVASLAPPLAAEPFDYAGFARRDLARAMLEQDIAWLTAGSRQTVLGNKLYGLELYEAVADRCGPSALSERKQWEINRLKWKYLSELLALPERRPALERAGDGEADAIRLVARAGCQAPELRRILDEVGE